MQVKDQLRAFRFVPIFFLWVASDALAQTFSYPARTRAYSGWESTLKGDTNTIGMSGATVALPSSISAAESNPAGLAMEVASLSAQINKNTVRDNTLQRNNNQIESNQWGLAVAPPPWGFGISYYTPKTETGTFLSPNTGHIMGSEVSVKVLRLTVARVFFESKLSVGVSAGFAHAIRNIGDTSYDSNSLSYQFGALYRLPERIILGVSYTPAYMLGATHDADQAELPGFNQDVVSPNIFAVGIGWIPNRFFKVGFDLHFIGSTNNTALLADQNIAIGSYSTVEPRLGASYVIGEFKNFKVEYAMGTYYEPTRVTGASNRLHGTAGLEANPWFINTGAGIDYASDYKNVMISIGVDLVRTLRTLKWIPRDPVPPYDGFFPDPKHNSPDGLAPGLTEGDEAGVPPPSVGDVKKIIADMPAKIEKTLNPTPTPSPSPAKKKRKLRSFRKPKPDPAAAQ